MSLAPCRIDDGVLRDPKCLVKCLQTLLVAARPYRRSRATRTVRPLRHEGQAVAWRPGQDVVLSGYEASSHYCSFLFSM